MGNVQLSDTCLWYHTLNVSRLRLVWWALLNLFTGKLSMTTSISVSYGAHGITASQWVKKDFNSPWKHMLVTFDGNTPAKGYVDGELRE